MRFLTRLSFRAKIGLGAMAIVVLASLASGLPANRMAAQALTAEIKKRGSILASNIARRAVEPVLSMDLLRLKNMVDEIRSVDRDIDYAFILDDQGRVLAHTFSQGFPVDLKVANRADFTGRAPRIQLVQGGGRSIYDVAAPVMVGGAPVGEVRIGLSRTKVQQQVDRYLWTMAGFSGAALGLALLFSLFFAASVSRRIDTLRRYAENLVTGELAPQSPARRHRNCWEMKQCGLEQCPAHGDEQRRCWYLAGVTGRRGEEPGAGPSCRECSVYQQNKGDELQDLAETFDVMALSLRNHIQELRRADRELRRQERLMRTVLDATPDLVSLQDANMVYQAANRGFAEFVGRRGQDLAGATDDEIFEDQGRELLSHEVREVLGDGRKVQREVRIRREDKEWWFHVVLVPVEDQEGRVFGVLRTARDISRVKQVQAQLVQAQKMESLGKLAGGVAHEINTPLGVILGYAQLLQDDVPEDGQVRADLAIIEKQAKVCRQIVADLLGFSRQTESAKQEMCFNNSLMEAVSLVQHTFTINQVEIVTRLDDRMPIIYGDPEKLKQVWINLLNNARDAMPEGGAILVESELNRAEGVVTARVADTGSGVGPEDMKRIFDPFYTTKQVGEGTGLGLSVSFGIVEDHQGAIRARSPVPGGLLATLPPGGPGTLFTVTLPLDHEAEAEAYGTA